MLVQRRGASSHGREVVARQGLAGTETIGFAWSILLAFLRVTTRAPAFAERFSIDEASGQVAVWLAAPAAVIVDQTAAISLWSRVCSPDRALPATS